MSASGIVVDAGAGISTNASDAKIFSAYGVKCDIEVNKARVK
jgi:hypothetical protein